MESFSRSTGNELEIIFTSERFDQTAVLSASDAAVLLQTHDCGVGALADAMACELPILGSRRPEIAEYAPNRRAALLSTPGDMRQATDNLLNLARDAELRRKLAGQAALLAQEQFDRDAVSAKLQAIYSTVLSGRS